MTNALTIQSPAIANCITSQVTLKDPFTGKELHTNGIWDTGATNSVITKSSASALGLKPISRAVVNGVHGSKEVNVYFVNITLNNNQITLNSTVTECEELSADHSNGMLIGMDIISRGDFCVTNSDGHTTMTFMVPSQRKFDFVEEIREFNKYVTMHQSWLRSGNNRCPCGSGKQWQNCHGKVTFK